MTLEVELKYRVEADTVLDHQLAQLGAERVSVDTQSDFYFNHPSRDFGQTDEAFRIRVQQSKAYLTYKGPRIDAETKTRREIEVPLSGVDQPVELANEMFKALGFRPVATVAKSRTSYAVAWQERTVTLTRDTVEKLGLFIEIELIVDDHELTEAKECLLGLAEYLGLSDPIHTSYLELLIASETGDDLPNKLG